MDDVAACLTRQAGVISRRQVLVAGHDDAFIAQMIRRRRRARVHPGVYVDHTGPLVTQQCCLLARCIRGVPRSGSSGCLGGKRRELRL